MSPREKKLLTFFAVGGFLVLNFLAYSWYGNFSVRIRGDLEEAKVAVERSEMLRASNELVADQMDWLAEHEPEPIAYQDVQVALQELVDKETTVTGLTRTSWTWLDIDDSGTHYHRARFEYKVTGQEQALYQWFDRIKNPEEFRAITQIQLSPNREDDSRIDCTAIIEQWFVPEDYGT